MAKDNVEDLIATAKNRTNPIFIRKSYLALAKAKVEELERQIADIEWSMN